MSARDDILCNHCSLPIGLRPMERRINGETRAFCCYGCCIAFQVKSGKTEEWEAAWLLVRLGVGGFLSMNIMMFSLLLYSDAFIGVDADMLPWIHFLLWLFATPAVLILGGPYFRETWLHGLQGRLTSSALIVLGVTAAYLYSAFAVLEGAHACLFRHRLDGADAVHPRPLSRGCRAAPGRRATSNHCLPRKTRCATVVAGGVEIAPPGTRSHGRHAGAACGRASAFPSTA